MNKQAMKHIDIMVLGLGYVGLPFALSLSKYFKVTGFDTNTQRDKRVKSKYRLYKRNNKKK